MKCPNCGLDNPEAAERCACGYAFEGKASSAASATPQAKRSPARVLAIGVVGIVLGIFGVVEGLHTMHRSAVPPPPSSPVYQTYDNAAHGIRMKVLQGWKIKDGRILGFSGPGGVNVQLQVGAEPGSLEDFTKQNMASIRRIHESYADIDLTSLDEAKPTTLAGSPGYAVEYAIRVKGTAARGWQVWTVKESKAYVFTFSASEHDYGSYLPIAKTMAGSLETP
jgi:hypothetical protein